MSKCYYLENDKFIELDEVWGFLQKRIVDNFTVKLEPFDASEGEGGHFILKEMVFEAFNYSTKQVVLLYKSIFWPIIQIL